MFFASTGRLQSLAVSGVEFWVLHMAEADLEGRDRVDIIRRRLNPIAEPQPFGLQCPGDDFRRTPVEPVWPRD